jgi:hypothetical protein
MLLTHRTREPDNEVPPRREGCAARFLWLPRRVLRPLWLPRRVLPRRVPRLLWRPRRVLRLLWRPLPLPGRFQSKDNAKSLTRPLNSAGKCHCRLPTPTRRRSPERLNGRKRRLYKVRDAQPFETYPQERHDANFAPVDLTTETQ